MEANQEMDIWKQTIQKDIQDIKDENSKIKEDIRRLQDKEILQDQKIGNIEETLKDIKDDTKWLRRAITNAIIGAVISGVICGAIALFYAMLQK